MRIHALKVDSGEERVFRFRTNRLRLGFEDGKPDGHLGRSRIESGGLLLLRNGRNLIAIDEGLSSVITIDNQPVAFRVPHVWLEQQNLQIGEQFLLRWTTEPDEGEQSRHGGWIATLVMLLLGLLALIGIFGGMEDGATGSSDATTTAGLTHVPTLTSAPAPSPSLQPLAQSAPTQTRIDPRDSPVGVGVFAEIIAGATTTAKAMAVATVQAPCVKAPLRAERWDPDLVMVVEPACVRIGESYWRLVEARWLDDEQFDGHHHLFVDVVDESEKRIQGASFVMRWQTGECRRYIQGIATPLDHGAHCAMFSKAGSYDVAVDGLPGEIVKGLGLGAVQSNTREWRYLTSIFLRFQRVTFPTN